jgi:putative transposase
MIRSHVIKLDPTCKQEEFFRQCVGTARFAFNWALKRWRDQFAGGQRPTEGELRKELNTIKEREFTWMLDVPKAVIQQAIKNLGTAYRNFFNSLNGQRRGPRMAAPDFKSRHRSKQSARLDNGPGTFSFAGETVRLPKIGEVKTHEALRFDGRPLSATVSHVGGRWWLSVQVELPDPARADPQDLPAVGVDLGLATAVTLSTGETISAPKPLQVAQERLGRLNRSVSRKQHGSNNRCKAATKLNRAHWRVGQIRRDFQHQATSAIAKRFGTVCVESLNVAGMMRNHSLARAISDVGWSEMVRQLKYKCTAVQEVGRFYPSSKTCAGCGDVVNSLPLLVRSWACPRCECVHDRDVNAAVNIRYEGLRLYTASCAGINACGDGSSGSNRKTGTKLPSSKQEPGRAQMRYKLDNGQSRRDAGSAACAVGPGKGAPALPSGGGPLDANSLRPAR